MAGWGNERGGGGIKALVFVAALLYGIYAAVMVVSAKSDDADLAHEADVAMKFAGVNRDDPKTIQYKLNKKASDNKVPIKAEEFKIEDAGAEWHIAYAYERKIHLVFWDYKYPVTYDKRAPKG